MGQHAKARISTSLASLRFRVLLLVLLCVAPAVVLIFASASDRRTDSREQVQSQALQLADAAAASYSQSLQSTRLLLVPLAQLLVLLPTIASQTEASCTPFFARLLAADPRILSFGLASADGTLLCGNAPGSTAPANIAGEPVFRETVAKRAFVFGLTTNRLTDKPAVQVAYPLVAADGQIRAVLLADMNLEVLSDSLAAASLPDGAFITLRTSSGLILARYPDAGRWVGQRAGGQSDLPRPPPEGTVGAGTSLDGVAVLFATVALPLLDAPGVLTTDPGIAAAAISVGIPRSLAYESADARLRTDLVVLMVVALVAAALGWFGSGLILRRLRAYAEVPKRFAAGDLTARVGPPYARNELGAFGRAFDEMADAVVAGQKAIGELNGALEARVIERTAQLDVANKELEAFSYSVSHDLRAPLRSIDGFSQAIAEDYAPVLDDAGRDMLGRIRAATTRMGQLIDDLLQLSRVTRAEIAREEIDLSDLASTICAELRESHPDRDVAVSITPGLRAIGDRRLMRVALENLLNNAWKFTVRVPAPRVEVAGEPVEGSTAFCVRDNGAGFDMAYADKLFGAFQRLHGVSEFPGTGIGLATVQRIVHRHGGRVWAEGAPGQGATFYFTLGGAARV